jgi:outer membrane lipoprotein SlyB
MEANKSKTGLHPLMTAAAISVTVFSAVGVGAMTGLLPHSFGSSKDAAPAALAASAQPQPTVDNMPGAPASIEAANMPPASAASTPAAKPAHKPAKKHVVAHASTPARAPADFSSAPPPPPPGLEPQAQAPVAPQPVPAGSLGVVESVREVSTPAKTSNGVGPIAGGIAGAVLGNQVGHGDGRTIATVLGAAAGAFGGRAIEQNVRATKHWEITVRLDDGSIRTVSSPSAPIWHGGERIRLLDGRITPA